MAETAAQAEPFADLVDAEETPQQRERARRRALTGVFWRRARGFWGGRGYRWAWWLTLALLVVILLTLAAQYGVNRWNRAIFDALEKRDASTVWRMAVLFVPLAVASVTFGVVAVLLRMTMQRRWRAWLNDKVLDGWLANGRYYQLNLVSGEHQNPEYRIAEDLRVATDAPVDFAVGVLSAFLSAITFMVVLWNIGGTMHFEIAGATIAVPGFLVVAAIIYACIASISMLIIGRRFVRVSEDKNQAEAEYRYALTRVRENGESIALLGGEAEERAGLQRHFTKALRRWREICGQHMRTTVVSQGSNLVAAVVPVMLTAPKFLDGSMSLGTVMQATSAFVIVQSAFGWLVDNYPRLADWSAGARRIASLMASLEALEGAEKGDGIIHHGVAKDAALRLANVSVTLDDGTMVVEETEVLIAPGERVLFAGESGTGKSTLIRAIAGLWPWGGGTIEVGDGLQLFLLPQRPYVPTGTLRRAVAYPAPAEQWPAEQMTKALEAVGLGYLGQRLEEESPWDQTLSGGEKQRLAFARVLLHRPDIVVLDEATSALDPNSQDALMGLICEQLKEATILSVAHRPELEAFHSRKIVLARREHGARLVADIPLAHKAGRFMLIPGWFRRRGGESKAVSTERYPGHRP
ncbi:MAG: ABC transporter ATP-binding protein/permease [Alphaproteobacteria bacterium]|nr:ABC transporter ATP-binding protein/permease [Alphaproteobacteria bacterium]MCW5741512.1 ABC transporter ATP-binding protein/permease [Alphaproteobacteria bacterium]